MCTCVVNTNGGGYLMHRWRIAVVNQLLFLTNATHVWHWVTKINFLSFFAGRYTLSQTLLFPEVYTFGRNSKFNRLVIVCITTWWWSMSQVNECERDQNHYHFHRRWMRIHNAQFIGWLGFGILRVTKHVWTDKFPRSTSLLMTRSGSSDYVICAVLPRNPTTECS